ncbi:MAG: ParM/StbA family protein [Clostridium sp.]
MIKNALVMNLHIGNDNGNSEQDLTIDGKAIAQPNVYSKIGRLPNLEEMNPKYIAENIHSNLIVTIESPSINKGLATTFYIGKYALKSGKPLHNIKVGADNSKIKSDVPVVNTLANVAGYAVGKAYKENGNIETLDVKVDMTTALPVNQYSKAAATEFAQRFLNGTHKVTVFLGAHKVLVNLEFEYTKTLPEAVPTVFYLKALANRLKAYEKNVKSLDKKSADYEDQLNALDQQKKEAEGILGEYMDEYRIDVKDLCFDKKSILHVAIGEGTTEYPVTEDIDFNPNFIQGTNNGVGHAIERVLDDFIADKRLTANFSRQNYSEALKDERNKYHVDATDYIQAELEAEAIMILNKCKQEVGKTNNALDLICVYGGGSILMKEYLYEELKEFAKSVDINVLYVPKPYSVMAESLGMYEFTTSPIFKQLKKMYLQAKKK